MKYDCIIIGAGMSGLAAGIRLSHFGKKVCIIEKHSRTGGLNSYYFRNGIEIDTGLHAMTNFVKKGGDKNSPLMKLLRQLRIPYDSLQLCEQNYSIIKFQSAELRFSNDFNMLNDEISRVFPREIEGFRALCKYLDEYNELDINTAYVSARSILARFIKDPFLADMIFCPLMYYGSAVENDMDFSQFAIMFKSIFREGFCRPEKGVRHILGILEERFNSCGGELSLSCEVRKIITKNGICSGVELADGTVLESSSVLSSIGSVETLNLCDTKSAKFADLPEGQLAFIETIFYLKNSTDKKVNLPDYSIMFFNSSDSFEYKRPIGKGTDLRSGVVCCPHNFDYRSEPPAKQIRITALSDYSFWNSTNKTEYRIQKENIEAEVKKKCSTLIGFDISEHIIFHDIFTPMTVKRYTGHRNGAVYGSPLKIKDGITGVPNLFLCGTDQGFLGITGAMLSGISIANMHLLK